MVLAFVILFMCHAETERRVQTAFMFMSLKFYMSLNVNN